MCKYQRLSRQNKSKASRPRQRKKTVDAKDPFDRGVSFPTCTMWEEERSRPQSGRQDRVQKLIEKIYVHAHTEPLDGRNQADEDTSSEETILDEETDDRMKTLSEEEQKWLTDIGINGLCGGWATLHRANPERFAAIWTALACWNGEGSIARHMNRYCKLSEPAMGWENYIISLGDSAVGIMKALEPEAGYVTLPDGIVDEPPEFNMKKAFTNPNKKRVVHVKAQGAGKEVYRCIVKEPCVKGDPYVIHIETDQHHMSIRTRYIHGVVRIEEIVESEYAGVVVRPDQRTAEDVLEHGIYLDKEPEVVPKAQTVYMEFYNAK